MATRTGADQMRAISRELKDLGNRRLKREFNKAMRDAVSPLRLKMRQSALEVLPHRGGLNRRTATATFRISNTARGIRFVGRSKDVRQLAALDDPGVTRHPVFLRDGQSRRSVPWVRQRVTPGWASTPWQANKPSVQSAMIRAADNMGRTIDGMR